MKIDVITTERDARVTVEEFNYEQFTCAVRRGVIQEVPTCQVDSGLALNQKLAGWWCRTVRQLRTSLRI